MDTIQRKWDSKKDLQSYREKLDEEYASGLPDYLVKYFDEQEQRFNDTEFFINRARERGRQMNTSTSEERAQYIQDERDKFWAEHTVRLTKKKRRLGSHLTPVYEEPIKAEERIKDEANLTVDDISLLVSISSNDLHLFAMRYFPHYLRKADSRLHLFIYKTLSREINRKARRKGFKIAIAAPRGNSKSSLVSIILPIWCICYNKKKFILLISETANSAEEFLEDVKRELQFNAALRRDFPHIVGPGPTWKRGEIITNNNIKMMSLGRGNQIRGRNFGSYRPDLLVFDDIEDSESVRSKTTREFIRHFWFNKDAMHVEGESGTTTDFLFIGTILGKDSLLNALLTPEEYPDWISYKFKAVEKFSTSDKWLEWEQLLKNRFDVDRMKTARRFFEENEEEMLKDTEVLWPEGDPYYDLMITKVSDLSGFSSEKMNDPLDPTKILVKEEDLHLENFNYDSRIKRFLKTASFVAAFDPSVGKKKDADFSVLVTGARDRKTGHIYITHINIRRRSVDEQIDDIIKEYINIRHKLIIFETNGFQIVIADNLRKKTREMGLHIPVKDVPNYSDKHMRIQSIVPLIKDGTIVFDSHKRQSNQQYALALEQLLTYSENASNDDFPDALEMLIREFRTNRFKMLVKQASR